MIRRAQHKQSLPAQLASAGNKIRATLAAKPFDPPYRNELAPDAASQQALRFLIETKEVIDLSPDLVIAAASFSRALQLTRAFLRVKGRASTSELRQHLGVSRRIVIPLLERFDKEGMTRREGDARVLR
jgi:selenocysteine-specific elongation factor